MIIVLLGFPFEVRSNRANLLLLPCKFPGDSSEFPRIRMENSRQATSKDIKGSSQTREFSCLPASDEDTTRSYQARTLVYLVHSYFSYTLNNSSTCSFPRVVRNDPL